MNTTHITAKCRICWEVKEIKVCISLTTKWAKGSLKSIKDVILLCVPWMNLKDDCYLCKPCLWQLKFTYDFIERCLKTENILNGKNNLKQVSLEDILENSLKRGNKIQIIFENPLSSQTEATKETDPVNPDKSIEEINADVKNLKFKTTTVNKTIPSEHDYCIKKGTQINIDIINGQQNENSSNLVTENIVLNIEPEQNFSEEHEKENIFLINDSDSDTTTECTTAKSTSDPSETSILNSILTSNKKQRSKTVSKQPIESKICDPEQVKLENELKELLDIAAVDVGFISVHSEMSAQQQHDLVRDGVNIINLSKDSTKKKRVIYFSRDLCNGCFKCSRCKTIFLSRCEYLDHIHLHNRGKIKTPGEPIFTCKVCSETFTFDIEFQRHSRTFHGFASPHQCTKCNKRFKTFKELGDHIKRFKGQEKCISNCARCGKGFPTQYSLRQHENNVKDAPCCNYKKCKVCFEKFTPEDFKIHSIEVHPNYLCPECGKSFAENGKLSSHIRNVHNAVKCMCHECGKIVNHPKVLEHHIQTIHGEKNYICDKCPRQFASKNYLKKHLQMHLERTKTLTERRRWSCEKCGRGYIKKESLILHQKMFHLGVKRFMCPICNEGFLRSDYLKRHLRAHDKYIHNSCTICKRSFSSEWRLESHMFAGHDENGISLQMGNTNRRPGIKKIRKAQHKFVCKICNKILATKMTLDIHYRAHLNLRTAKCDECGIIFQGITALKKHRKLHEDPNFQFSCNICHAYKSSSIELESHMREVHRNKKYKCNICHEKFGRKYLLHSHETIFHVEEVNKKQALFEALQQNQIIVPSNNINGGGVGSKKNVQPVVDIDKVYNIIAKGKNEYEVVSGGSGTTLVADSQTFDDVEEGIGSHVTAENNVLYDDYQSFEDAMACRVLEEEEEESSE